MGRGRTRAARTGLSIRAITAIVADVLPPATPSVPSEFAVAPSDGRRGLGSDLLLLGILAGIAVCLGLGTNRWRVQPLPWVYASKAERLRQSVARVASAQPSGVAPPVVGGAKTAVPPEMIDLAKFHDCVEAKAIILDARSPLFYRAGHVPGARSLARETFEADYARQRAFLEAHRQEMLVVYCAGDACADSRLVADALCKLGYPRVLVYEGGWEEWQQAGLPEERG